jgi:hypothetical protein
VTQAVALTVAAMVGAVTSLAALAVHRAGPAWLGLAVATSLGVAWVLRATEMPRLGAAYCLGWLAVFGIAVAGRAEGDYVVAGDLEGYLLMAVGFALVVLGITSLGRGRGRTGPDT